MTEIGIDSWVNSFFGMKNSNKVEALNALRDKINKSDNVPFKKEMSGFLNGIRLVKSHEKIVAAIEHHLKHVRDERDLYGYIDRRIAVKYELIPSDWGPQQWNSIMNSILRKNTVPGFRAYHTPLPRAKQKGRKPTLYVSDDCDVESLFDARSREFDPTNEDDAQQMVKAVKNFVDFERPRINLYEELKQVNHPLFPDLTVYTMRSATFTWLSNYLIPSIGGIEVWKLNGLELQRRG
jgi:hypothetical protein